MPANFSFTCESNIGMTVNDVSLLPVDEILRLKMCCLFSRWRPTLSNRNTRWATWITLKVFNLFFNLHEVKFTSFDTQFFKFWQKNAVLIFYGYPQSGIKQHKCIILQLCQSKVWHDSHGGKIKALTGPPSFLKAVSGMPFLAFPSFWRLLTFIGLWPPCFISKANKGKLSLSEITSLWPFHFSLPLLRTLVIILSPLNSASTPKPLLLSPLL